MRLLDYSFDEVLTGPLQFYVEWDPFLTYIGLAVPPALVLEVFLRGFLWLTKWRYRSAH